MKPVSVSHCGCEGCWQWCGPMLKRTDLGLNTRRFMKFLKYRGENSVKTTGLGASRCSMVTLLEVVVYVENKLPGPTKGFRQTEVTVTVICPRTLSCLRPFAMRNSQIRTGCSSSECYSTAQISMAAGGPQIHHSKRKLCCSLCMGQKEKKRRGSLIFMCLFCLWDDV
jgi:hypothetical protein